MTSKKHTALKKNDETKLDKDIEVLVREIEARRAKIRPQAFRRKPKADN